MVNICKQFELFGKGIGNETRFKILITLFEGAHSVNELAAVMKISQPSVSQHLKVLKAGGIVIGVKNGQEVYYHIDRKNVTNLLRAMLKGLSSPKNPHGQALTMKKIQDILNSK